MRTVHCPLCGLRFSSGSALDQHARDGHAPPMQREGRETLTVRRSRYAERPVDQVLSRRGAHRRTA